MSTRRSAFDVLMANSKKKSKTQTPPAQESSPKKRKSAEKDTPEHKYSSENANSNVKAIENAGSVDGPRNGGDIEEVAAKKPKLISPDESVAELKKKAANFDPKKAAYWGDGERVPFMFVAKAFGAIEEESGRIAITDIVTNMLRTVIHTTPDDLLPAVYLSANKIAPAHEGLELGIGDASIIKALAEACGAKEAHIKKQYKDLGDLGLVAKASRSSQSLMRKPEPLTVAKVFSTFRLIAKESGKDSQEKKKNYIKSLLVAATDCEPQYLIRLLQVRIPCFGAASYLLLSVIFLLPIDFSVQTKLRIGLAEQTLLVALSHATVYSEKDSSPPASVNSSIEEAEKIVKQVYSVIPVYDKIVPALLSGGVCNLQKTCSFSPGVPVGPMLAKATKGVSEIVDKFQDKEFTCEYKYDGERAQSFFGISLHSAMSEKGYSKKLQIHYMENGSVEIYSRNAERNTGKFPDVVAAISRLKKPSTTSFVLDCELVAYDREKQKILPFQILSTRARKNVVVSDIKVNVCIYAFDILYLNGQPLIQEQLSVRREHLYSSFEEEPGYFQFATSTTSNDLEEITQFLEAAVNGR
nr:DNA ligase 1 [Ipomoea batatas]